MKKIMNGIIYTNNTKPTKPTETEYQILRIKFLEEEYGDNVIKCQGCGHPRLDGYVCKKCGADL